MKGLQVAPTEFVFFNHKRTGQYRFFCVKNKEAGKKRNYGFCVGQGAIDNL